MGFGQVHDYVAGKVDWLATGLPAEGRNADKPTAGSIARRDVPTCALDDEVGSVRDAARAAGDLCVVVNTEHVVLGLLGPKELADAGDATRAEDAMQLGPSTFRPHVAIEEMAHYMVDHDLEKAPVTTSEGKLVGVLYREDALKAHKEA